ncbi:MAG: PASTA domain-containing protein, partial [Planctomycetia bacterium]|nr:PASTA domain-containing protein [Planctomycetia bacterium]
MKVHLMERVPGSKGALTVLEIEFTSKARNVRVTTSEGLEPLDLRGERTGGTYDAAPTLTRLHVPLRVTADGSRTATVSVTVTDAAGLVAAEAWEGTVRLESTRRKAPSAALLLGGFGAVALGIGAFVVLPLLQPPSVPSLVGKPQGEAERALRALGFAPVVEQVDSEGNDGRVIAQVPAAETQPPKNAPVLLRVGRRPATIEVPQLVGRMRADAESALAGTGVQVAVSLEDAPETSDGRVLRQRPAAGNNVAPGTTIELVVGRRPAVAQRDVPDVTGLAVADAVAALERAGLVAKVEPAVVDAGSPKVGKVVEQAPAGGARLAERGAVTVRVGEEAKPPAVAQIPYVVGEVRAAAERAITAAGFDVVVEEIEAGAGAAGTVTSQDPAAGAARVGTRVTLRVPRAAAVAVTPPAMTDTPPAMTDAPPAMGDPVVVAPPAM